MIYDDGMYAQRGTDYAQESSPSYTEVDIAADSTDNIYIAATDGASARLYYGPLTGLAYVDLEPGIDAEDIDVHVTDDDLVIVTVRGAETLAWTAVQGL